MPPVSADGIGAGKGFARCPYGDRRPARSRNPAVPMPDGATGETRTGPRAREIGLDRSSGAQGPSVRSEWLMADAPARRGHRAVAGACGATALVVAIALGGLLVRRDASVPAR